MVSLVNNREDPGMRLRKRDSSYSTTSRSSFLKLRTPRLNGKRWNLVSIYGDMAAFYQSLIHVLGMEQAWRTGLASRSLTSLLIHLSVYHQIYAILWY